MIPRKLALRIWAACLRDQARVLTGESRPAHRVRSVGSAIGARADRGRRMAAQADAVESWLDTGLARGADLPDETVAQVAAYLYSHGDSVRRVKWWLDNRGVAAMPDVLSTLRSLLEIH